MTARKGARCGTGAGSPHPHQLRPGYTGRGTPAAHPKEQAAGGRTAPDTRRPWQRWKATPPGDGPPPPPRHGAPHRSSKPKGRCWAPTPAHTPVSTWVADPDSPSSERAAGGATAPEPGRPSQRRKAPPQGRPPTTPAARNDGSQERTLLGPQARTNCAREPLTGPRNPGRSPQGTGGPGRDIA